MRHSFLDKYSNLNSPVHRINPRLKVPIVLGYVLLVIFIPIKYFLVLVPILLLFILISRVPILFFFKRSLVILPFVLLVALSGGWDILLRGYLSVLAVILLSSTTRFSQLLKALQGLGCPKLIIMIMSFMYRYIFVLIDELMRMKQAKDSRTFRPNGWEILANLIGVLFIRAYERAERVYIAMCSRGFTGEIK